MDRNSIRLASSRASTVALRKESVDRNWALHPAIITPHVSLSARRAWIEILYGLGGDGCFWSLSARRAWIEIVGGPIAAYPVFVALRKESVDRNQINICSSVGQGNVALRKESVDRNSLCGPCGHLPQVALRKESVDRNSCWLLA